MRKAIEELFGKTILFKYCLPCVEKGIDKTDLTTKHDYCYESLSNDDLARIIYNGIIDYCKSEALVDIKDLNEEQIQRLIDRYFRYNGEDSIAAKERYGFYGECFLNSFMQYIHKSNVLLAKGYLYIPTNRSEITGYDCYHIVADGDNIKLILGEAKFYQSYKYAIDNALSSIQKAFGTDYLKSNFLNILKYRSNISCHNAYVEKLLDKLEKEPCFDVYNDLVANGAKLIYPICILSNYNPVNNFDVTIKNMVDYVNSRKPVDAKYEMEMELQFIFVPVNSAGDIKKRVIEWISKKEPLL